MFSSVLPFVVQSDIYMTVLFGSADDKEVLDGVPEGAAEGADEPDGLYLGIVER